MKENSCNIGRQEVFLDFTLVHQQILVALHVTVLNLERAAYDHDHGNLLVLLNADLLIICHQQVLYFWTLQTNGRRLSAEQAAIMECVRL